MFPLVQNSQATFLPLSGEGPGGGPREGKPYLQKIEQFMFEDITRNQFLTLEMFKRFNETYSASIQAQG